MSFSPAVAAVAAAILAIGIMGKILDVDGSYLIAQYLQLLPVKKLLIAVSSLIAVYYYAAYRKRMRRIRDLLDKIPGPPVHPIPFLGHAGIVLDLDRSKCEHGTYALIYQMLTGCRTMYGKDRLLRMWMGTRPFVLCYDADSVETILTSNTLVDKSIEYNFLKPWLGEGLVTSNKSKWKHRRKILTPAFHFRILQDFAPVMNEQADVLVRKVRKLISEGKTSPYRNLLSLITLCTLDTICETAMGTSVKAQENESEYVKCLHQVSELNVFRLTRPWLYPDFIFYLTTYGRRMKRCLREMHKFTRSVIKERKEEWITNNAHLLQKVSKSGSTTEQQDFDVDAFNGGRKRLAFLDLLLYQHLVNCTLSLDDVREEVDTFMFAGHDTTAMAISWTLYLLGLHQDVQQKVRQEVDQIFDEEEEDVDAENNETLVVTEEMMKKMKYLDCVLKEVQRIYPTAPFIARQVTQDTLINGFLVPEGTTAAIMTFLVHRDPAVFENPEKFDPDRFLPENCVGRHPFAFIPFSAGPRNCIGQKFAMMEQKIVMSTFLRNFKVTSVDPRDKMVVVGEMVLRPRNGFRVMIEERVKDKSSLSNAQPASGFTRESPDLRNY